VDGKRIPQPGSSSCPNNPREQKKKKQKKSAGVQKGKGGPCVPWCVIHDQKKKRANATIETEQPGNEIEKKKDQT